MILLFHLAAGCRAESAGEAGPVDPRAAARETETQLLLETAQRALAEGRTLDAARSTLLGRTLDPARFEVVWSRLLEREDADVLTLLANHRSTEPAVASELRVRATRARVHARYAGGASAAWERVTLRRGRAVLEGVVGEYVVRPDETVMVAAVAARMALLWELRDKFPRWKRLPTGSTVVALIEDAVQAGLPEEVAVGEGVEAALVALDPYTLPVWPAQLDGWKAFHAGVETGIGVDLVDGPNGPVVTLPRVGGPAWFAGVHSGDRIVAVDDRPVGNAAAASAALHGKPGTKVRVAVDRAGAAHLFSIERQDVPEETVRGWTRTDTGWSTEAAPGVAFVHISAFRPDTDETFDRLIGEVPPRAVVLDLRGNGGGDVMAAINVADRFVASGQLGDLVGRTLPQTMPGANGELPWNAAVPGHVLEGVPVVVLVDGRTASAAEIVAGALRERANGVLVGEPTYGKGLSQALRVDDKLGVGWQVTNSVWTLPSGSRVEDPGGARVGLQPDLPILLTPGESLQVDAFTRKRELPHRHPDGTPVVDLGTVARAELVALTEDPQLREALRLAGEHAR